MTNQNQNQEAEIEEEDTTGEEVDVSDDKVKDKGEGKGTEGHTQTNDEEDVDDLDVEVTGEESQREKQKTRSEERRLKKNRRNRHRHRDQALIREQQSTINELRRNQDVIMERLDVVAGQTDRVTAQNIDDRIAETARVVDAAKRLHTEAIISGDAEKASQAMDDWAEARDGLNALKNYKHQLATRKAASRDEGRQGPVERSANNPAPGFKDKTIERKFKQWHAENPWYDVRGSASSDADSRLAYGMDTQLEAEGFDPASDEYWEELDKRLSKKLPHHYNSRDEDYEDDEYEEDDNQRGRNRMNARDARQEIRKKPPTGGSPRNTPNGPRKTITISSERASAMREMGYQPGTADWKRMAKKYAEYDKQNS